MYVCVCVYTHECGNPWRPEDGGQKMDSGFSIYWLCSYQQLWASQYRCWKLHSGPLEKKQAVTTVEPSLQSLVPSLIAASLQKCICTMNFLRSYKMHNRWLKYFSKYYKNHFLSKHSLYFFPIKEHNFLLFNKFLENFP